MVPFTPLGILFLIFLLEAKHFFCDGPLQTSQMVADKAVYGKKLGLVHAGLHGVFSFILLPVAGAAWGLALILAIVEAVIHYHIDFTKENIVRSRGWTVTNRRFWWALASDQALHHFTYLAMGAVVVLWP
jgi:hypothetical protein